MPESECHLVSSIVYLGGGRAITSLMNCKFAVVERQRYPNIDKTGVFETRFRILLSDITFHNGMQDERTTDFNTQIS